MAAKISVIIPFYKVEKFAERCIRSVLEQTFTDFELILVDDGSPDNCGKICDEFAKKDKRIKVFHTENRGLSAARNLGIEKATGEYISFIDGDDAVAPDYLEYLYKLVNEYDVDISTCVLRSLIYRPSTNDFEMRAVPERDDALVATQEEALKLMLSDRYDLIASMAKLYKREILAGISYPVGQLYEDVNTSYKTYLKAKQIVIGKGYKYLYTVRQDSISHSAFIKKDLDLLRATDEMCAEIVSKYPKLKNVAATNRARSIILLFGKMVRSSYVGEERQYLIDSLKDLYDDLDESCYQSQMVKKTANFIITKPDEYARVMQGFNAWVVPK
jgi:glycosyltransferase involved in cell wall biosynthesis